MASPVEYADRYLNLCVPHPEEGKPDLAVGISVGKYLLGVKAKEARSKLLRKVENDFKAGKKNDKNYSLRIRVFSQGRYETKDFDTYSFTEDNELYRLLRFPFGGKGSPEGVQAVLQIAASVGPGGGDPLLTPSEFQKYCDDYLGTDCNGFVGNFLRQEMLGKHWSSVEAKGEIGPQELMNELIKKAPGVIRSEIGEISHNDLNLLVEVDRNGKTIPGGSTGVGHTAISEPGQAHRLFPIRGMWVDCPSCPEGIGVPGIWVIESTGGNGLSRSWYHIFDHPKASRSAKWRGVFSIHRGVKNKMLDFRVKALIPN